MSTMIWLLRREYWEHRVGLRNIPLITAGVLAAIATLTVIGASIWGPRAGAQGASLQAALRLAIEHSPVQAARQLAEALQSVVVVFAVVQALVLFFYLLGALYDDRRDRSAWFWSSMPVSHTETVASKALIGLLVMPLVTIAVTLAFQAFLVVLSLVTVAVHGVSPWPLLGALTGLGAHALKAVVFLPIHVLLALPAVGWLLLVSAWARRRPFLWAVLVPLIAALCLVVLEGSGLPAADLAGELLGRLGMGLFSNPWYLGTGALAAHEVLTAPGLWVGALAGVAGLAGAINARTRSLDTSD